MMQQMAAIHSPFQCTIRCMAYRCGGVLPCDAWSVQLQPWDTPLSPRHAAEAAAATQRHRRPALANPPHRLWTIPFLN